MKRFALRSLKDLGFGKTGSEESILDELQLVVKNIDQVEIYQNISIYVHIVLSDKFIYMYTYLIIFIYLNSY